MLLQNLSRRPVIRPAEKRLPSELSSELHGEIESAIWCSEGTVSPSEASAARRSHAPQRKTDSKTSPIRAGPPFYLLRLRFFAFFASFRLFFFFSLART